MLKNPSHVLQINDNPLTPMCNINIPNSPIRISAVVDTGADISVMRRDLFLALPSSVIISRQEPGYKPCVSATGDQLDILCIAEILIIVGGLKSPQRFLVVRNLRKQLILGSDFLGGWRAIINFEERTMILDKRHKVRLYKKHRSSDMLLPELETGTVSNRRKRNGNYRGRRKRKRNSRGRNMRRNSKTQRHYNSGEGTCGPASHTEEVHLEPIWHDRHRYLDMLSRGIPINKSQKEEEEEDKRGIPVNESQKEEEEEAGDKLEGNYGRQCKVKKVRFCIPEPPIRNSRTQEYHNSEEGTDYPDSMPLWLLEKYERDGCGPTSQTEWAHLEEKWHDRQRLLELLRSQRKKEEEEKDKLKRNYDGSPTRNRVNTSANELILDHTEIRELGEAEDNCYDIPLRNNIEQLFCSPEGTEIKPVSEEPPVPHEKREGEEIAGSVPDIGSDDPEVKEKVMELLKGYEHMFAPTDLDLGKTDLMVFEIKTKTEEPVKSKAYRCPWVQRKLIEDHIKAMLDADIIEPSCSPYASPVLLVPKPPLENPNGGDPIPQWRFCIDFRALNEITVKNSAPLPNINDVLDSLQGSKVFSSLDLKSGYWQIAIRKEHQHKTAFISHCGLFQFKVMPFGLANAPAAFCSLMSAVLGPALYKYCLAYLDDLIVYSENIEDHYEHLRSVFELLEKGGLRLKPSKCSYLCKRLTFLGHVISAEGVHVSPDKVEAIKNFKRPTTQKLCRGFLGLVNYYRKFIPNMAEIALPLTQLTKKHVRYEWTTECQESFDRLKQCLITAPVLSYPSPNRKFLVYCDASNHSIGAILAQRNEEDTAEHVVQYASEKLSPTQLRWSTTDKEAYAIVRALSRFRQYLLGTKFTLFTDHKPVSNIFTSSFKTPRVMRWSALISEFHFEIRYLKGSMMRADFLSRLPPQDRPTTSERILNYSALPESEDRYLPEIDGIDTYSYAACDRCGVIVRREEPGDRIEAEAMWFMAQTQTTPHLHLCSNCEEEILFEDKMEDATSSTTSAIRSSSRNSLGISSPSLQWDEKLEWSAPSEGKSTHNSLGISSPELQWDDKLKWSAPSEGKEDSTPDSEWESDPDFYYKNGSEISHDDTWDYVYDKLKEMKQLRQNELPVTTQNSADDSASSNQTFPSFPMTSSSSQRSHNTSNLAEDPTDDRILLIENNTITHPSVNESDNDKENHDEVDESDNDRENHDEVELTEAEFALEIEGVDVHHPNWKQMDNIPETNDPKEVELEEVKRMLLDMGYAQDRDPELRALKRQLKRGKVLKNFLLIDEKLYHVAKPIVQDPANRLQLVVPEQMQKLMLKSYHDAYHMGIDKTYGMLHERVYWENMYRDTVLYCRHCQPCARTKLQLHRAPLRSRDPINTPATHWGIDTSGPFPEAHSGERYVISLVDLFTGWVEAFATSNKSALTVARIIMLEIIPRFSTMEQLLSDCGTEFLNQVIDLLSANMGISRITSTPYQPHANGAVEKWNHVMKTGMKRRVHDDRQQHWPDFLSAILFAHRVAVQTRTRQSPFVCIYGREPILPADTLFRPKIAYHGDDWTTRQLERLHQAFAIVRHHTSIERERQKRSYDSKATEPKLKVGQNVWYYWPKPVEGSTKLNHTWKPMYRIVRMKGPVNAVIVHEPTGEERTVHINALQPLYADDMWDKLYSTPEPVANRRIQNPKLKNQDKETAQPTRTQPLRAQRLAVPGLMQSLATNVTASTTNEATERHTTGKADEANGRADNNAPDNNASDNNVGRKRKHPTPADPVVPTNRNDPNSHFGWIGRRETSTDDPTQPKRRTISPVEGNKTPVATTPVQNPYARPRIPRRLVQKGPAPPSSSIASRTRARTQITPPSPSYAEVVARGTKRSAQDNEGEPRVKIAAPTDTTPEESQGAARLRPFNRENTTPMEQAPLSSDRGLKRPAMDDSEEDHPPEKIQNVTENPSDHNTQNAANIPLPASDTSSNSDSHVEPMNID